MRMRPIALALLLAGMASTAHAADLKDAYALAREGDPQFAAAAANAAANQEGVVQARAALLPQLNAQASLNERQGDSTSIGTQPDPDNPGEVIFGRSTGRSDTRNRSLGVQLNQTIYDHSDYTQLDAARARAEQAQAQLEAAEHALAVRVAEAYFTTLTAIETLASARAEEAAVKRQLDQAETRLEVGLAPITDVHEARARYDGARANAIAASIQLDDAREALAQITGKPLSGLKGLSSEFQPKNEDTEGLDAWVARAEANNPGLRAATLGVTAAEAQVATARAGHLPTLSASAGWNDAATWGSQGSGSVSFPADSASDGHNVGITLTVPIYSGGATQSRVRQALFQRDAAGEQREEQRRAVVRQTRNAWRSLVAGSAEVEARRLAVVSAKAALEAGEAGLEVGTRTIVDVLIAQQALFGAQRDYARARHTFLVNQLRLKQAAGTLTSADLDAVNAVLVADAESALDATR